MLQVPKVLSGEQLRRLREIMNGGVFVRGAHTAAGAAAKVKNNLQLPTESDEARGAARYLLEALGVHPLVQLAVQPRTFAQPLFSQYEVGMSYGYHLDSPLLNLGPPIRSDVSLTVFLNGKDDYDGGELLIDVGSQTVSFKGEAGDCVVYASSRFHRVAEVTRGVRLVAVLWAQSLVRHESEREILFDLGCALQFLLSTGGEGTHTEHLRRSYNNLLRLWAEL